jgi:hypothetical protein
VAITVGAKDVVTVGAKDVVTVGAKLRALVLIAAFLSVLCSPFVSNAEMCESVWYAEGEGNGYGCNVYCRFGDNTITIYCPDAYYTSKTVSWTCGDRDVDCGDYDCVNTKFTGYTEIDCQCVVECPTNYEFSDLEYKDFTYTWCDVCPSIHQ